MGDHDEKTVKYAVWKNLEGNNSFDCLNTENVQTSFDEKERNRSIFPTDQPESQDIKYKKHCTPPAYNRYTRVLQRERHDITTVHRSLKQITGETTIAERNREKCGLISGEMTEKKGSVNGSEIELGEEAISLESNAALSFDDEYSQEKLANQDEAMNEARNLKLTRKADTEVLEQIKIKSKSLEADIVKNGQRQQNLPLRSPVRLENSAEIMDIKEKRLSLHFTGDRQEPNKRRSEKNESTVPNTFGAKMDDVSHSYLQFGKTQRKGKSKLHCNDGTSTPETKYGKEGRNLLDNSSVTSQNPVNTLEDALRHFGLWSRLQQLENSLEDVRRHKKTREDHESDVKEIDKELQKLSLKFHPDKMKSRGCAEEEFAAAHSMQAALNATRTVFNTLSDVFLSDLATDHKYGFYTKLNINSVGNGSQLNKHIYEVLFQINLLSEIKQQRIITEIGKFLKESKCCVKSYLSNKPGDFIKNRDAAIYHLKCCIRGYKSLRDEYKVVEKHCKYEKFENINKLLSKKESEILRELELLRRLKKYAKESLSGNLKLYDPLEDMDDYFVQPFVYYTNVILMCNIFILSKDIRRKFLRGALTDVPKYSKEMEMLLDPYYLSSYCNGNKQFKSKVIQILRNEPFCHSEAKIQIDIVKLRKAFDFYIEKLGPYLEKKFKSDGYSEYSTRSQLAEELKKCMSMMTDFRKKEEEFSKGIDKLKSKTEELEEKYYKIMKKTEDHNQNVRERFERNRSLVEKTDMALSNRTMQQS